MVLILGPSISSIIPLLQGGVHLAHVCVLSIDQRREVLRVANTQLKPHVRGIEIEFSFQLFLYVDRIAPLIAKTGNLSTAAASGTIQKVPMS